LETIPSHWAEIGPNSASPARPMARTGLRPLGRPHTAAHRTPSRAPLARVGTTTDRLGGSTGGEKLRRGHHPEEGEMAHPFWGVGEEEPHQRAGNEGRCRRGHCSGVHGSGGGVDGDDSVRLWQLAAVSSGLRDRRLVSPAWSKRGSTDSGVARPKGRRRGSALRSPLHKLEAVRWRQRRR
jgi:hypothetical protein